MSKTEILAELPKLSAQEREEILEQLWRMEESVGPTEREKNAAQRSAVSLRRESFGGSVMV